MVLRFQGLSNRLLFKKGKQLLRHSCPLLDPGGYQACMALYQKQSNTASSYAYHKLDGC